MKFTRLSDYLDADKKEKLYTYLGYVSLFFTFIISILLCIHKSLGYDEAYTFGMIQHNFKDIIEITSNDVHSPFYYFLLKAFCTPFRNQIFASKLFSAILFIGSLLLGRAFVFKIYGSKVTFYWLLLSGFMPAMIIQSSSPRMYTLGLFLTMCTVCRLYHLYVSESALNWILFTISCVLTMYVHTFTLIEIFFLYLLLIGLFLYQKSYKKLIKLLISGVVAALCYVPWLIVLWHQMRRWAGAENGWSSMFEKVTWKSFLLYFSEWFSSLENPRPLTILFSILLFVITIPYMWKYVRKTKDCIPIFGPLLMGIVFLFAMIISVAIVPCFLGRYLFPMFGLLWLFLAVGLKGMKSFWAQSIIILGILICAFFAFREEWHLESDAELDQYITYMEENYQADDVIMVDNYFTAIMTIYSPKGRCMIYGYKPEGMPFDSLEVFREWEQLDGVDTVWFLSFWSDSPNSLSEYFDMEKVLKFRFSYYNVSLYKATRRSY